jgi:hypothetical protein
MRNSFGHGSLLDKDCQAGWRMRRRAFVMWVAWRETAVMTGLKQRQDRGVRGLGSVMLATWLSLEPGHSARANRQGCDRPRASWFDAIPGRSGRFLDEPRSDELRLNGLRECECDLPVDFRCARAQCIKLLKPGCSNRKPDA